MMFTSTTRDAVTHYAIVPFEGGVPPRCSCGITGGLGLPLEPHMFGGVLLPGARSPFEARPLLADHVGGMPGRSKFGPVAPERPPQNPILAAFRAAAGDDPGIAPRDWFDSTEHVRVRWGLVLPEHVEHARKVLARLAALA